MARKRRASALPRCGRVDQMTPAPTSPPATTWYFDVISPFAYLALREIEDLTKSVTIAYRPILFAGLLQHWKHLGPAEIPPKRIHTYRLCVFEAQRRGIPFRFPPAHPFNPLKPLRLLTALDGDPRAVRTVMDCIWREGSTSARRLGGARPVQSSDLMLPQRRRLSMHPKRRRGSGPTPRERSPPGCSASRHCVSATNFSGDWTRCQWR